MFPPSAILFFTCRCKKMSRDSRDHPGRIIVKNYPSDTSSRDLQIMFEKYGKIDDCELNVGGLTIVVTNNINVILICISGCGQIIYFLFLDSSVYTQEQRDR